MGHEVVLISEITDIISQIASPLSVKWNCQLEEVWLNMAKWSQQLWSLLPLNQLISLHAKWPILTNTAGSTSGSPPASWPVVKFLGFFPPFLDLWPLASFLFMSWYCFFILTSVAAAEMTLDAFLGYGLGIAPRRWLTAHLRSLALLMLLRVHSMW